MRACVGEGSQQLILNLNARGKEVSKQESK